MKLNRGGLILSAIYAAISIPLILLAYSTSDFKGAYVLGQLAGAPAGMLFTYLGAVPFVMRHPWLNNIPVFFLISLALCYVIGWICSCLARSLRW
jgi:hypothetical protein